MDMTAKMTTLSIALETSAAALVFRNASARDFAWQRDHQNYEFKHPKQVTCREYIETDEVYQNYVTAWALARLNKPVTEGRERPPGF